MNTKAKIIIGTSILVIGGTTSYIIYRSIRKKRIAEEIYKKLDDTASESGAAANLSEDDKHKANFGFDPNFWKEGSGGVMPNANLLMIPQKAREIATEINSNIGVYDDEDAILSEIKKLKSKGQLSQVTHAYSSGALNYGDLASDLKDALEGGFFEDDRLKELNSFINNLPN